jgi:hypothetical protein
MRQLSSWLGRAVQRGEASARTILQSQHLLRAIKWVHNAGERLPKRQLRDHVGHVEPLRGEGGQVVDVHVRVLEALAWREVEVARN